MAYNFILPDELGATVMEMAAERQDSPAAVIAAGIEALGRYPATAQPLSGAEFEKFLGITTDERPALLAEAKHLLASLQ